MKLSNELNVALKASKAAAKLALSYFGKPMKVEMKKNSTPVTIADKECEKTIIRMIQKEFPEDSFLGEENGNIKNNNTRKWIIDPIDGTKNFIRGLPYFSVLIALEIQKEVVLGVINSPVFNDITHAVHGKGCFHNNRKVYVSNKKFLKDSVIFHGTAKSFFRRGYIDFLINIITLADKDRCIGNVSGFSFVAQGNADIFIHAAGGPWDFAAGKIIIQEARGRFTDFTGNTSIYTGNAIAANKYMHKKIMKILKKV